MIASSSHDCAKFDGNFPTFDPKHPKITGGVPASERCSKTRALLLTKFDQKRHAYEHGEQCSRTIEETDMTETRYIQPGWFTRNVFNRTVRRLTRWGLSVAGSRELRVRGRKSGEWRSTPVNLVTVSDERYLVAPRGTTQWVRNLRAAGGAGELKLGRRVEAFHADELADAAKTPVLREYLRRWAWEVGAFFEGVDKNASDADLARIAPDFPVFRVTR
jgi:deazaflavin-dependent oxidoreductase (nitroreductase family)